MRRRAKRVSRPVKEKKSRRRVLVVASGSPSPAGQVVGDDLCRHRRQLRQSDQVVTGCGHLHGNLATGDAVPTYHPVPTTPRFSTSWSSVSSPSVTADHCCPIVSGCFGQAFVGNRIVANECVDSYDLYMAMELRKAGSIWVDGDRFFDREVELASLSERVSDGIHTLLTAQRRMGKTSLVRELLRRLADGDDHETLFVDFEDAETAEDAVAELAIQAESLQSTSRKIRAVFANVLRGLGQNVEELAVSELRVKFRAGIDAGTWRRRGDEVFAALAESPKPVVLAIDELPIFVNRLLKGEDFRITPERRNNADLFMSWLRRNGQLHRDQVCIIVSGSIGLEPILGQAGLSAQANFLSPLELSPWSHETASDCIGALARSYGLDLSTMSGRDVSPAALLHPPPCAAFLRPASRTPAPGGAVRSVARRR